MFKSPRDIIRSYDELTELSDGEAKAIYRSLNQRDRRLAWIPGLTGFAVFWVWILVFGKGYDWLESRYAWDILDLGPVGYALLVLMGFPGALTFASILVYQRWKCSLQRAIETHLKNKRCLWCGYCLTGLEREGGRVRCPECGEPSPVRCDPE